MAISIIKKLFFKEQVPKKKPSVKRTIEPKLSAETVEYPNIQAGTCEQIVKYIDARFSDPALRVFHVSAHLRVPQSTVSACLTRRFGKSFRQYLNDKRINHAIQLLEQSDLPIAAVAYKSGYSNIQHFNKIFKSYTNSTPVSYRNEKRTK